MGSASAGKVPAMNSIQKDGSMQDASRSARFQAAKRGGGVDMTYRDGVDADVRVCVVGDPEKVRGCEDARD